MPGAKSIGATSVTLGVLVLLMMVEGASASVANAQTTGDGGAPAPAPLPACIAVGTEARWVPYGYNHVVVLRNGCSKPATCSVSTDVNPQSTSVEVASGTRLEVLTFTASPAQTFNARVACKLH